MKPISRNRNEEHRKDFVPRSPEGPGLVSRPPPGRSGAGGHLCVMSIIRTRPLNYSSEAFQRE